VNRPKVLGPVATVKTLVFLETVARTVNRPNGSRYAGFPEVILIHDSVFLNIVCEFKIIRNRRHA